LLGQYLEISKERGRKCTAKVIVPCLTVGEKVASLGAYEDVTAN